MPFAFAESFLPLWYNALEEEIGLYIRTDAAQLLMNTLYDGRQRFGTEELQELMIFKIDDQTLFIAKRSAELPE